MYRTGHGVAVEALSVLAEVTRVQYHPAGHSLP